MRLLYAIACNLALYASAYAHEVGCDGKPPTEVIKKSCCGDHDWLRLQPGMWKQDGNVYLVLLDGKWEPVVGHDGELIQPLPSTDGCDYVWYRRQSDDGLWHDNESAHMGAGVIHFFCLQLNMAF